MHLPDTLRAALRKSGESLTETSHATGIELAALSRFRAGICDLNLYNGGVLAEHLGFRLVRAARKKRRGKKKGR